MIKLATLAYDLNELPWVCVRDRARQIVSDGAWARILYRVESRVWERVDRHAMNELMNAVIDDD